MRVVRRDGNVERRARQQRGLRRVRRSGNGRGNGPRPRMLGVPRKRAEAGRQSLSDLRRDRLGNGRRPIKEADFQKHAGKDY